jgi:hypothetical protein
MRPFFQQLGLAAPMIACDGALVWNVQAGAGSMRVSLPSALAAEIVAAARSAGAVANVESDDEWFTDRLADLEREGRGPLAGIIWEGAPNSSRSFAERLVRGPRDRWWHFLAPPIGALAASTAGHLGRYAPEDTDLLNRVNGLQLATPSLCFLANQDRLAPPEVQRSLAGRFRTSRTIEVSTWHLHCADTLGPAYTGAIRTAVDAWLPSAGRGPEGPLPNP